LRGVAAVLLCACASGASAQLSGTLSGVSDYRYRGNTLTDRMPAAQAGVTYDDPKGWYAGAFASTVRLKPPGGPSSYFQTIAYAGYATRLAAGISAEVGGDYSAFGEASELNYGEVFVGAATESLSARIYYSPRYFGESSNAVYGEINATQPLVDRLRLHVHAGVLRYRYESPYGITARTEPMQNVFDARIGLRIDLEPFQLEVAWVGVSGHTAAYLITGSRSPNTIVASLSLSFYKPAGTGTRRAISSRWAQSAFSTIWRAMRRVLVTSARSRSPPACEGGRRSPRTRAARLRRARGLRVARAEARGVALASARRDRPALARFDRSHPFPHSDPRRRRRRLAVFRRARSLRRCAR
jgi:uncharacterized protein (TIGR02001 family)